MDRIGIKAKNGGKEGKEMQMSFAGIFSSFMSCTNMACDYISGSASSVACWHYNECPLRSILAANFYQRNMTTGAAKLLANR